MNAGQRECFKARRGTTKWGAFDGALDACRFLNFPPRNNQTEMSSLSMPFPIYLHTVDKIAPNGEQRHANPIVHSLEENNRKLENYSQQSLLRSQ